MNTHSLILTPAELLECARAAAIRAEQQPAVRQHLAQVALTWACAAKIAVHYSGDALDLERAARLLARAHDVTDLPVAEDTLRLAELHLDIARAHIKLGRVYVDVDPKPAQ
jgi:hypothetical protein